MFDCLKRLGGASKQQVAALMRPVFCAKYPEYAEHMVETTATQLCHCNLRVYWRDGVCFLRGKEPSPALLEAIDIMLELSNNTPLNYWRDDPPVPLRFQLQSGEKVRMFAVAEYDPAFPQSAFRRTERMIWLFGGRGHPQPLPVPNKQFLALRQENGMHRFFTL